MVFDINKAIQILQRTPKSLETLLIGLSDDWIYENEGVDTWSPFDIIGHLIHGEKTDWIIRCNIILGNNSNKKFEEFDRFAQFVNSKGKTIEELLEEFEKLRIKILKI